jgi:hypothetical protein
LPARADQVKVKEERVPWTEVVPRTVVAAKAAKEAVLAAMEKEQETKTEVAPIGIEMEAATMTLMSILLLTPQPIPSSWLLERAREAVVAERDLRMELDQRRTAAAQPISVPHDHPLSRIFRKTLFQNILRQYSTCIRRYIIKLYKAVKSEWM